MGTFLTDPMVIDCRNTEFMGTFLNDPMAKIEVLVEAASEQTATIKGMTKQQGQGQTVARKFPIQTVKDLNQMNMEINDTNRELYIDAIKIHIMHGGIMKNLKNVLSNTVGL
ncbi:hypothetical protein ACLKA6_000260 [Drosophila palustris]